MVQALAKEGARLRIAVRDPQKADYLKSLSNVGDITPVYANIMDPFTVGAACIDADYVLNLVGILYEKRVQTFENIHIQGAAHIAEAAQRQGVKRLIHVSAMGANPQALSKYSRSKGRGEQSILAHYNSATLVRPNILFGEEDAFINRFANLAVFSPILPLFGKAETKIQPAYVHDVALGMVHCLKNPTSQKKVFELGGPTIYTFKELLDYILKLIERKRFIIPVPYGLGNLIGTLSQYICPSLLTADQVKLLQRDLIVSPHFLHFSHLNITPQPLEEIIPSYLKRYRPKI